MMKKLLILMTMTSLLPLNTFLVGRFIDSSSFDNKTDGQLKIRIEYNQPDICAPEEFLVERDKRYSIRPHCSVLHTIMVTATGTRGKAYGKGSITFTIPHIGSHSVIITNKNDGSLIAKVE
jgi:hypothetical protein